MSREILTTHILKRNSFFAMHLFSAFQMSPHVLYKICRPIGSLAGLAGFILSEVDFMNWYTF